MLTPISHQAAHILKAAGDGNLTAVMQYGAVRYFVDNSGETSSYPDSGSVSRCFDSGWLAWADDTGRPQLADDEQRLRLTGNGAKALARYETHPVEDRPQEPCTYSSHLRGEPHDPREAIRVLRRSDNGEEIRPGQTISEPFGEGSITYLGPTMVRREDETVWRPGRLARVLYPGDIPWVFLPAHLGAVYDDSISPPA